MRLGISLRAYQNYERGEREVTKELICALLNVFGVDPVWFLTGEGEIHRCNMVVATNTIDVDLLKDVVAGLEMALRSEKKVLEPHKKAEVISLLYDMYLLDKPQQIPVERILRLVS